MPHSRAAFNFEVTKSPEGGPEGAMLQESKNREKGKKGSRGIAEFHLLNWSGMSAARPGQQKGAEPVGPAPALKSQLNSAGCPRLLPGARHGSRRRHQNVLPSDVLR